MQHRPLGPTGLYVSELCLGTMTFGAESDETDSHAILDAYRDAGGTFVDTADVYTRGASEEIIGRWLARSGARDEVVLATKVRLPMVDRPGPNDEGLSRRYLTRAVEASLRRLGVDHVDLLQTHAWDPATPVEETLEALDDLVTSGKVRYLGVSNVTGWQLERMLTTARFEGLAPIVSLQPQYSLLERGLELELGPLCVDAGVGMLPWSPLGGGWLTGKYHRDARPSGATRLGEDPDRGVEAYDLRNTEQTWQVVDALAEVAEAHDATMSQVALRWVTDRPAVASTILGVRTVRQLEDNLGAVGLVLDEDARARLDEVSAPVVPGYPYAFVDDVTAPRRALLGE